MASTTSVAVSLKDELVDGQRKLLASIENTGMSRGVYTMNANLPEKVHRIKTILNLVVIVFGKYVYAAVLDAFGKTLLLG